MCFLNKNIFLSLTIGYILKEYQSKEMRSTALTIFSSSIILNWNISVPLLEVIASSIYSGLVPSVLILWSYTTSFKLTKLSSLISRPLSFASCYSNCKSALWISSCLSYGSSAYCFCSSSLVLTASMSAWLTSSLSQFSLFPFSQMPFLVWPFLWVYYPSPCCLPSNHSPL